jgi:succinate dehydrogenase / fumarate reductase, membrane anchor subunit
MTRTNRQASHHWRRQRISAVVLAVFAVLFLIPFVRVFGGSQSDVLVTYANPFNAFVAVVLLVTLFAHVYQGLDEVIVDYTRSKRWLAILHSANHIFCWAMGFLSVAAIARIALFP